MTVGADVIALINSQGDRNAIWHVVIDPAWPMSRLCGAWVDVVAPALYVQRYLLPFGEHLPDDMTQLEAHGAGMFDPNATRDSVVRRIAELDAQHKDSPTKSGTDRAPVPWPQIPERLDWANLPDPPRGVADDPLTSETIAVARWLSDLATAWAGVEALRLSRTHLSDGESKPRPLPVVLRGEATATA